MAEVARRCRGLEGKYSIMLDDQEESARIAVKALGDMRNSPRQFIISLLLLSNILIKLYLSGSPTSPYISTSSPSSSHPSDPSIDTATGNPPAFVSRMSTFPLVGSALQVYEQGKASSRVVKVRLPYPHSSPSCNIIFLRSVWRRNGRVECQNHISPRHRSSPHERQPDRRVCV